MDLEISDSGELIVNLAPTGMIPTKTMTPYVPLGVDEIVEDVHATWEIGITMVHLHARDMVNGEPTYRAETYAKIIEGIRKFSTELIICVSLSGRTFHEFEKRIAPLALEGNLKPDMGSLTLSSVNFNRVASINTPEMIQRIAYEMKKRGIMAELEVFDTGMVNYAKYLERKGFLEQPHYFNLLLGNIACAQADPLHLGLLVANLPPRSHWSASGIGRFQLKMNSMGIAAGGGVRTGLEDNIWYDSDRKVLARNVDLVRRIHRLAEDNERRVMKASTCRKLLSLEGGNGRYGRRFQAPV